MQIVNEANDPLPGSLHDDAASDGEAGRPGGGKDKHTDGDGNDDKGCNQQDFDHGGSL
jgi:hypothetical protein